MPQLEVEYLNPPEPLPDELDGSKLRRRALQVIALLAVIGLVVCSRRASASCATA